MKKAFMMLFLISGAINLFGVDRGYGETEEPFQIAIFHPLQLRDENTSILALRVSLLYGRNVAVKGLDVGLVNHCTGGESLGLQYGLVGFVEGDFMGWQDNSISIVKGEFSGLQTGIYNEIDHGVGLQVGWGNKARSMRGLQLGFVNYTETMHGLQIGLLNIIRDKEDLPVFVFVNWSF
jgi:hypothetical protein